MFAELSAAGSAARQTERKRRRKAQGACTDLSKIKKKYLRNILFIASARNAPLFFVL